MTPDELTPQRIVAELDRYIVGQTAAKRSVAIALRNRYRRERLQGDMRDEVIPKNILMIGPTGVGKTEIARRLATLVAAPFIKVEATKYTEVGYVGRDVESMVRDLVEAAIRMVRLERLEETKGAAEELAIDRLADVLDPSTRMSAPLANPFSTLSAMLGGQHAGREASEPVQPRSSDVESRRAQLRDEIRNGFYDVRLIEIEVEESPQVVGAFGGPQFEEMGGNIGEMLGNILPKRRSKRKLSVAEAKEIFRQEEAAKLVDNESLKREAVRLAERNGIIFIDEMDKIAGGGWQSGGRGPDVSREGVQRDILPIVEGSTVMTKHGPVKTDHVLFIGAGAFHMSKPSDLIPELQGRFPIRVELDSLSKDDFKTILTQPKNALIEQYRQLLATDGVTLEFTDSGIDAIARLATQVNEQTENIGARRLHTMLERVLETVAYESPEKGGAVAIDDRYVEQRLAEIVDNQDLSHYIL
ncbi:MAG: HslU--HslV peptidase ATPase subunit [Candidatus Eremiobacter antarcticus]|nr:ATP-dependent protease ATPase subunit HslU [Candidatus Eremiobacteraeota bacterium]MBC5808625.1 ATP-dependent protease ATPase subunit HslU [Candidatus Eremiobacteraeota bacterium]PZR64330.1 MAG: HslU--HslV peptidase ATPase subunit [Candidatus Eremiobacter sp. RRmetagenome_bin22]